MYAQLDYNPRRDIINGTAPSNTTWHTGSNELAKEVGTPYFIAKDYGVKYLKSETGYQIIQPSVTATQSEGSFIMSTITIDRVSSNETVNQLSYSGHASFEVLDGQLQMEGELISLWPGDVVFILGNITYKYFSNVVYTKFLHIGQGSEGLDSALISWGESWEIPVWPTS